MDELQHFGIPGMKWGHRKPEVPTSGGVVSNRVTYTTQAAHIVRHEAGVEATRVMLRKYGGTAARVSGKAALKGAGFVFSRRAARGSGIALKLLGSAAKNSLKIAGKGGKAYLKTAIAIGKLGLKAR